MKRSVRKTPRRPAPRFHLTVWLADKAERDRVTAAVEHFIKRTGGARVYTTAWLHAQIMRAVEEEERLAAAADRDRATPPRGT